MTLNTDPFPIIKNPGQAEKNLLITSAGSHLQIFFMVFAFFMVTFHARTEVFVTFSIIFAAIVLEASVIGVGPS